MQNGWQTKHSAPSSRAASPHAAIQQVKERLQSFHARTRPKEHLPPADRADTVRSATRGLWSSSSSDSFDGPISGSTRSAPSRPRRPPWDDSRSVSEYGRAQNNSQLRREHAPLKSRPSSESRPMRNGNSNCSPRECDASFGRQASPHKRSALDASDIDARLQTLQNFLRAAKKA